MWTEQGILQALKVVLFKASQQPALDLFHYPTHSRRSGTSYLLTYSVTLLGSVCVMEPPAKRSREDPQRPVSKIAQYRAGLKVKAVKAVLCFKCAKGRTARYFCSCFLHLHFTNPGHGWFFVELALGHKVGTCHSCRDTWPKPHV